MKISFTLPFLLSILFLTGCMQTRYITEQVIKNEIENHKVGKFSSIKTYSIYKGSSTAGTSYLELTGYKYIGDKGLLIGADKYYKEREQFKGDNTVVGKIVYIHLNMDQVRNIIQNHETLLDKMKNEKPSRNEEIYHDYTVSDDLFISYRKATGSTGLYYLDLWIKGEKYSINSKSVVNNLNKFLAY